MKINVSEASGPTLDFMAARAKGLETYICDGVVCLKGQPLDCNSHYWLPTLNLDQGGPIIECEIHTLIERDGIWTAECFWPKYPHPSRFCYSISGPTPLIAAMRTYVASRLGPCVEVPSELW